MAQAGARFATKILDATVKGEVGIIEPSYVHLDADSEGGAKVRNTVGGLDYFSSNIELGVRVFELPNFLINMYFFN
jgi:malate dehydrogenase